MSNMYKALHDIEALLLTEPSTLREKRIYSIACAALNQADSESLLAATDAATAAALRWAGSGAEEALGRGKG